MSSVEVHMHILFFVCMVVRVAGKCVRVKDVNMSLFVKYMDCVLSCLLDWDCELNVHVNLSIVANFWVKILNNPKTALS